MAAAVALMLAVGCVGRVEGGDGAIDLADEAVGCEGRIGVRAGDEPVGFDGDGVGVGGIFDVERGDVAARVADEAVVLPATFGGVVADDSSGVVDGLRAGFGLGGVWIWNRIERG